MKQLQTNILQRALGDKEYEQLLSRYRENTYGGQGQDRALNLSKPITDEDMERLVAYLDDTDTPVIELDRAMGVLNLSNKAARVAVKYLYQNRRKLT